MTDISIVTLRIQDMRIFVALLLSFSFFISVCGQSNSTNEVEAFFKKLAPSVQFVKGGVVFQGASLTMGTDKVIEDMYSYPVPNVNLLYYKPYYKGDTLFKKVIDRILQINSGDTTQYSSYIEDIEKDISNLQDPVKQLLCITSLQRTMLYHSYSGITDVPKDLMSLFGERLKRLDERTLTEALIILGDVYASIDVLPLSLEWYMKAYELLEFNGEHDAELGKVEMAVSRLYLSRYNYSFALKSIQHYKKAIGYFHSANKIRDSLISRLSAAKLLLWNNESVSMMDIIESYVSNRTSSDNPMLYTGLYSQKEREAFEFVMSAALDAYNHCSKRQSSWESISMGIEEYECYWRDFEYELWDLLGNYFSRTQDWKTSCIYFNLAFQASVCDLTSYNSLKAAHALKRLSWAYTNADEKELSIKYIDVAIDMYARSGHADLKKLAELQKANALSLFGKHYDGLSIAKQIVANINQVHRFNKRQVTEEASRSMYYIYSALSKSDPRFADSAQFYYGQYSSIREFDVEEITQMSKVETDAYEAQYRDRIEAISREADYLTTELEELDEIYLLSKRKVKDLENAKVNLAKMLLENNHSLSELTSLISKRQAQLADAQRDLAQVQKSKEQAELDMHVAIAKAESLDNRLTLFLKWGGLIILVVLMAFGISFIAYKLARRRLKLSIEKMDADARNLAHNIKNDYADVYLSILKKDFDKAGDIATKMAAYLRLATNKYEDRKWTLSQELQLLHAYHRVKKAAGVNIEIRESFSEDIELQDTLVLSGVFTTLFHNSCNEHYRAPEAVFSITCIKKGKLLYFEISDNGTPSNPEEYIRVDRPNKGLALLKRRVEAVARLHKYGWKIRRSFKVTPINGKGTFINFIYPYVTEA